MTPDEVAKFIAYDQGRVDSPSAGLVPKVEAQELVEALAPPALEVGLSPAWIGLRNAEKGIWVFYRNCPEEMAKVQAWIDSFKGRPVDLGEMQ